MISLLAAGLLMYEPSTVRTESIFVYGTLKNPIIRTVMCRCITGSEPATLSNYQQEGLTIIPNETAVTTGRRIAVSPRALAHLDRYEDVPDNYRRETVVINNETVWVYIKNE